MGLDQLLHRLLGCEGCIVFYTDMHFPFLRLSEIESVEIPDRKRPWFSEHTRITHALILQQSVNHVWLVQLVEGAAWFGKGVLLLLVVGPLVHRSIESTLDELETV